jgi:hypothetical protein
MDDPTTPPDQDSGVKLEVVMAAALSFPSRTVSLLRTHQGVLGLVVVGGGSTTAAIVGQATAIRLPSALVLLIVVAAALRMRMRSSGSPPPSTSNNPFRAELDAHVTERNDLGIFRDYRMFYSEAYRSWIHGEFKDLEVLRTAKENLLNLVIQAETRRLRFLTDDSVSLLVVEETGDTYSVRRSFGDVGLKLRRGMKCPRNTSMDELLKKFAPYNYPAFFSACDRNYFLVALSDTEISVAARSVVEAAAGRYQNMYQFFQLLAVLSPPVVLGSETSPT